jgi:uncharacterized protein (TIGR02452 family)
MIKFIGCRDSADMAQQRRRNLDIPRDIAADLGRSAVAAGQTGHYYFGSDLVEWGDLVQQAVEAKASIRPEDQLPLHEQTLVNMARVEVSNETTLGAAKRLTDAGLRPLALNFANGIHPGGGFLNGARAQEEYLCRSSALFHTLLDDPMYEQHKKRPRPDSTDWAILSPRVPAFRTDDGKELPEPWLLDFITCAAPVATSIGRPESGDLLQRRIHRVLDIAKAYEYKSLVLGAWGCGAFGNDPVRTATDFRSSLENEFDGVFSDVIFAITDWSSERFYLRPFQQAFETAVKQNY